MCVSGWGVCVGERESEKETVIICFILRLVVRIVFG